MMRVRREEKEFSLYSSSQILKKNWVDKQPRHKGVSLCINGPCCMDDLIQVRVFLKPGQKKEEFNKREKPLEVGFHRGYGMTSLPLCARGFVHACLRMCARRIKFDCRVTLKPRSFVRFSALVKGYRLTTRHPGERWQCVWSCTVCRNCHAHNMQGAHRGQLALGRDEERSWGERGRNTDCLVTKHLRALLWTKDESMTSTSRPWERKKERNEVHT